MAYDRYDRERSWRDDDDRRPSGSSRDQYRDDPRFGRGDHDRDREGRGFFERMGDEVRSWFGDEDDVRNRDEDRYRPSYGERDYNPRWEDQLGRGRSQERNENRDFGRGDVWDRDPSRRTSFAGSRVRSSHDDLHYGEWRRRQVEDLDRDYDDYRSERQSHFEKDFGDWRTRRQSKRQLLSALREHMEVVGSDDKHVGTIDRVAGDRIILTRSDPDAGGVHHSLTCSDIDRVEGDRVILDCSADKARERWRDESRGRALFEREDQGSSGPHMLDRSFSGTYR